MNEAHEILKKAKISRTFWAKRIIAAYTRKKFLREDKKLAVEWHTCACGKMRARKPFSNWGLPQRRPKNHDLQRLGYAFNDAVEGDSAVRAAKLMVEIESFKEYKNG